MAKPAEPPRYQILLPICAMFGVMLVLFGIFQSTPEELFRGMYAILTEEDFLLMIHRFREMAARFPVR